jgi:HSP20 family protein
MVEKSKSTQSEAAEKAQAHSAFEGSAPRGGSQGQNIDVQQRQSGGALGERRGQGALTRYGHNPLGLMQQLSDEMDQLFDSFFYGTPMRGRAQRQAVPSLWAPEVDVNEEGNELRVSVDLPGLSKDNVSIDVQEGALVIRGERREERTEGGEQQGFRRSERRYGSFYREIPLPEYVDTEKAEARMQNGVLNITFPITEERKRARRLEIQG